MEARERDENRDIRVSIYLSIKLSTTNHTTPDNHNNIIGRDRETERERERETINLSTTTTPHQTTTTIYYGDTERQRERERDRERETNDVHKYIYTTIHIKLIWLILLVSILSAKCPQLRTCLFAFIYPHLRTRKMFRKQVASSGNSTMGYLTMVPVPS